MYSILRKIRTPSLLASSTAVWASTDPAFRELQLSLGTHGPEPYRELQISLGTNAPEHVPEKTPKEYQIDPDRMSKMDTRDDPRKNVR